MLAANQYRSDFPAFAAGAGHFLDSAASSLKPQVVIDAMAEFAGTIYANVHRGAYRLSMESTERYEAARVRLAGFLNTRARASGTDAGHDDRSQHGCVGLGGTHLREGDRILLTHMEHHANLVPWQMVAKRTGAVLDFVPLARRFHPRPRVPIKPCWRGSRRSSPSPACPTSSEPFPRWPTWRSPRERPEPSSSSTERNWCPIAPSMSKRSVRTFSPSRRTRCWADRHRRPLGKGRAVGGDGAVRRRRRDDLRCPARSFDLGRGAASVRGGNAADHRGRRLRRRRGVFGEDRDGSGGSSRHRTHRLCPGPA